MPTSPAVLKAAKLASSSRSYAGALTSTAKPSSYVATSSWSSSSAAPFASTSKLPAENEDNEEAGDEVDDEPAWQGITQDDDEDNEEQDDAVMIDSNTLLPPIQAGVQKENPDSIDSEQGTLKFAPLSAKEMQGKIETQLRRVAIPPHRMTPLKRDWPKIYSPLVDECGLMVRMNVGKKSIEIKTSKHTASPSSVVLQRAVDFVAAYGLGFAAEDAVAMLRMEDLYVETFEIKDVKNLQGDHLGRAIGRIAGKDGKTRFTIENASRTRIVLADQKIHILGTFTSLKIARDAICALILGSPPGKVYNGLRTVAARQRQRF